MKKNLKYSRGITLIALVITIILLLILSGVAISFLTNTGLFGQALSAKDKSRISEYKESIRLAETEAIFDNNYPDNEYKKILYRIEEILSEQELFGGSDFKIENSEDTNKEIMTISTKDGYVFEVIENENGNAEITYIGKSEEIPPTIKITSALGTTNTITIKATTRKCEEGSIEFYIASEDGKYEKKETINNIEDKKEYTYIFENLKQNITYKIKAVAKTKYGIQSETEIEGTTGKIIVAGDSSYSPTYWTNGEVTVILPTENGFTTVYTIDGSTPTVNSTKYTEPFTVSSNCTVKYAYSDEVNLGAAGSKNITNIDTTAPSSFTIANSAVGVNSFTLSATFEDNESGLGKIIWYYKRPQDTNWQSEEKIYTELNGSTTGTKGSVIEEYTVSDMTTGGEVQAYAVGYDVAGNSITTTNVDENNPLTFNTETFTISYNVNGGEGEFLSQTKYYGETIILSTTEPTKEGYTFLGWSEDSTATSANYASGAAYSSNSSAILYAIWEEHIHSFTAQGDLRSAANCGKAATYWYKCSICGLQGDTYFSSGSTVGSHSMYYLGASTVNMGGSWHGNGCPSTTRINKGWRCSKCGYESWECWCGDGHCVSGWSVNPN